MRLLPTFLIDLREKIQFWGFVVLLDRANVIIEIHTWHIQHRRTWLLWSLYELVRALNTSCFQISTMWSIQRLWWWFGLSERPIRLRNYVFYVSNVSDWVTSSFHVLSCLWSLLLLQVVLKDLENHVRTVSYQFLINPNFAFLLLFQPISIDLLTWFLSSCSSWNRPPKLLHGKRVQLFVKLRIIDSHW